MKSRQAKIVLVFLLLGPLIAYAVLLPLAVVQSAIMRDGAFGSAFSGWTSRLADIKDFYLTALVPAAFVTVAALLLQNRKDAAFIIGSAVAGGAAAVVLTLLFGARLDLPLEGHFGYAFVGALTAGICGFVTRR